MGEVKRVETRSFAELWNLHVIDHDEFYKAWRKKNLPDIYVWRYATGARSPRKETLAVFVSILKSDKFNIPVAQGQFLFPKIK